MSLSLHVRTYGLNGSHCIELLWSIKVLLIEKRSNPGHITPLIL
jgi:hypothetical protein